MGHFNKKYWVGVLDFVISFRGFTVFSFVAFLTIFWKIMVRGVHDVCKKMSKGTL